jgi:hypothetical protein
MEPKRHDVTVRKVKTVAGYRQLLARLERAHKKVRRVHGERQAYALALYALAEFLFVNGKENEPIAVWLMELSSSLTDAGGKGLSSNVWRKFVLISLGMKALVAGGHTRKEASERAARATGTADPETILYRYDELRKGRVKNREAKRLFSVQSDALDKYIKANGFEAVANRYFGYAKVVGTGHLGE